MENQKKNNLLLGYNLQLFAEDDNIDDNADNEDQNDDTGNNDVNEQKQKTFSQDQVNRMMSREKKQGRNSILKELGINPNDEKALEAVKTLIANQKTDNEKAIEKEIAMQEALNEADKKVFMAEAKVEAMMAGIKPQYVDDAVTLALAKLDDETPLKNILVEFKSKYSIWFDDNVNEKVGQKGTGSSIQKEKQINSNENYGAKLAAQRKTANNKKYYWTN